MHVMVRTHTGHIPESIPKKKSANWYQSTHFIDISMKSNNSLDYLVCNQQKSRLRNTTNVHCTSVSSFIYLQYIYTLPKTNIAIENPPFWWYLQGNKGVFMGYVSFREGIYIYIYWSHNRLISCSLPKETCKRSHQIWLPSTKNTFNQWIYQNEKLLLMVQKSLRSPVDMEHIYKNPIFHGDFIDVDMDSFPIFHRVS